MKTLKYLAFCLLLTANVSCSCEPENLVKAAMWGFSKFAGDGYFPSEEIIAAGEFEQVSVNMSRQKVNGVPDNTIELRFHNGKHPALGYAEEAVARRCAEMYAESYSKIDQYQQILIVFTQADPYNPENFAMSEYRFEVRDLLENPQNYRNDRETPSS